MVERIRVDKATLSKNIKKLVALDYVRIEDDQEDKRVKCLFLTPKGIPAVKRIKEIHHDFYHTLCSGISSQDIRLSEHILEQMMENINQKVWHRMEGHHET